MKEDKQHSGKPAWANFKATVWHKSFERILSSLAERSRMGQWLECLDAAQRWFFPLILILSSDFEEQWVPNSRDWPLVNLPCSKVNDVTYSWCQVTVAMPGLSRSAQQTFWHIMSLSTSHVSWLTGCPSSCASEGNRRRAGGGTQRIWTSWHPGKLIFTLLDLLHCFNAIIEFILGTVLHRCASCTVLGQATLSFRRWMVRSPVGWASETY